MLLAGNPEETGVKFTVGTYGWTNGVVPEDMPALLTAQDPPTPTTLKKGTVVRVYVGKIPVDAEGKKTLTTPNKEGQYIVEPAGGGYWLAYVASPETDRLLSSNAYKEALPKLKSRLLAAKLAPKDLLPLDKFGTSDNAANAQGMYSSDAYEVDANGFPVLDAAGKPKPKGDSGDKGGKGGDKGGNLGLFAILGIGALALLGSRE